MFCIAHRHKEIAGLVRVGTKLATCELRRKQMSPRPLLIMPMRTAGIHHFIDRTYRESGTFQWVRETLINALEAGATRVEVGIEWQAVERFGVYRRTIADNGEGMTADQLREFFSTFGGGGKPIGGIHENFGVGAKTSLLPWNRYGVVVISWVEGQPAMIWVQQDPASGEYGLRVFETVDPDTQQTVLTETIAPFNDDEHTCDWSLVKPEWIRQHGTVVILLGNSPDADTVLGDPGRAESDIKGISSYLNRRIWQVPAGSRIFVHELRTNDRNEWPTSSRQAFASQSVSGPDRRINNREVRGAQFFIEYTDSRFKGGQLAAKGSLQLHDGTIVDWYLWEGDRPAVQSYASIGGYIGALYKNELYDVTTHHSTYRSFGVSEGSVRKRLWLIARPPVFEEGVRAGVYPRTDRNALLIKGGPDAGSPLPFGDWAAEFADAMPQELRAAIIAARSGASGTLENDRWKDRLAERFGARWKIRKLVAVLAGPEKTAAEQPGTEHTPTVIRPAKAAVRSGGSGATLGRPRVGALGGEKPAVVSLVAGGIPSYRIVPPDELSEGMLAAWQPHDPEHPEGVVLINAGHPVLVEAVRHWQELYGDLHADDVREEVLRVYGEVAVAKVAHSEHLKAHLPAHKIEEELRSEAALTMALLGLISEEAVIGPRLRTRFARRHFAGAA
jgi:hypothetical protein